MTPTPLSRAKHAVKQRLPAERYDALRSRYRTVGHLGRRLGVGGGEAARRVRLQLLDGADVPAGALLVTHPVYGVQFARPLTSDLPTYKQVFEQQDYLLDYSIKPRTIIDLGANVGYSVTFYHQRFPQARIVAVEPDAGNCAMAALNIRASGANAVTRLVHTGVWHSDAPIRITNPTGNAWAYRVQQCEANAPGAMQAITIDALMAAHDIEVIDLIKIDIEAGERFLFTANTGWLDRVNVMIIELHDRFTPGCREPVIQALQQRWGQYTETAHGENTLFVRHSFVC